MPSPTQRVGPNIGDICAALFSRRDNVTHHWAFIIPISNSEGEKFHVRETPDWAYERGRQSIEPGGSNSLVCVVKLGATIFFDGANALVSHRKS